MPMLCFAFFFENILIPVSKAFVVKDHSGALGMKSSLISLSGSLFFYASILFGIWYIKHQNNDTHNQQVFVAIYQNFDQVTSVIALIVMAAVALLQSQCYFQLALEQLCIVVDQI